MLIWQHIIILLYVFIALLGFMKGYRECKSKSNSYGKAGIFNLIGAFVWGDAVVFGIFWIAASIIALLLDDWILFLLTISLFWVIRSLGEVIYWITQQFSEKKKDSPEKFWFIYIFKGEATYFIYQIYWECIAVVSLISSIYFAKIWF
ncbi:hypothetical protein A3A76_05390 [Candidatus Woesebacteria bacterium RIFCSPLOWO2_01_FULL_39_23]|uniref:Uncharacterized protein n=2 Tax=Microgenomates group TaxID=1794810 RepID=A0A0H4T3V7_9BACT|nr:hypothetical protein [uncultured Microgenomates bacterium Rifle_16ft_4_minimus_37633]OGM13913.1 MAG: hypothetical protein A2141_04615 [Candidatus Woesebacteria bacterium RBG_16_40_11]OGM27865.1 MAG: hypothetical protein A2628_05610 [Candidatus Woesebacteria bacterium RIFCSPHIGHO2_01_FULL_40_22]OGM36327.1 MAG: hypothetical protein A3E41_02805 [Candidatus Woesebacteria bacterium RIFCSPHIGHO2_12_FULL_38_9]OGM62287.1 MAG: hypothetical protein A3A76_05390 [Candidatus Woesebacteria bacterium RIFCS